MVKPIWGQYFPTPPPPPPPPKKKKKKKGKTENCGHPTDHNYGHPLDRRLFFVDSLGPIFINVPQAYWW